MIPKIINYCWFGKNEKSQDILKNIDSWKKYCPEYEIIEWNESNFDIDCCEYVKDAYKMKKYAFVSDYARLYALKEKGGIYLDTDVELINNLNLFLDNSFVVGFQDDININTGLIMSEPNNEHLLELLNIYNTKKFIINGKMDTTTNVKMITEFLNEKGLESNNDFQKIDCITVYPKEYFCPIDYKTRKKVITDNTVAIHWFESSWLDDYEKDLYSLKIKLKKYPLIGNIIYYIYKFLYLLLFHPQKLIETIKKRKIGK